MKEVRKVGEMAEIIGAKIPSELAFLIEKIASEEYQTKSAVLRRLLVKGLQAEGYLKEVRNDGVE
jgi:hypothetical protein